MKVLHVETGRHLYGGALQVFFLLRGLRDQGEHVLVCPPGSAIAAAMAEIGGRVIEVPAGGDADLGFLWRLRRLIRRERPDLIHLHSRRGADLLGGLAGRLGGVPVVLSRRVDNPEPRAWVALKYRLYDRVITISDGIRAVLRAEGVPEAKLRCVHSAVDTGRYRPGGDRDWLRREFSLAEDALAVGMLAQFIERKGHRVLLEALPAIVEHQPRARFLLFGQGPLWEEIAAEVRRRGLEPWVQMPGFRGDLERILPALDLVVHPAYLEGLGVALLQAAACAVPIVAGRAGGIPEIVGHGDNGWLIEPGDAANLARHCIDLLADPERRRRFGAAGRVRAQQRFSIDAMVAGNLAVYREVLGRG